MKTCGDYGGIDRNGEPCKVRVKDGRCRHHSELTKETEKVLKTQIVELIAAGTNSLTAAAEAIDRAPITIWRWRQDDAAFDEAIKKAIVQSDKIRVKLVEDALYTKLIEGRGSAAEYCFYLANREPDRWKHQQALVVSGPDEGPIEIVGLDLSKLDEKDIVVLKELARKTREETGAVGG